MREEAGRGVLAVLLGAVIPMGCANPDLVNPRAATSREVVDARLDAFLREQEAKQHFSGVVLVMRDGTILHARGYGAATARRANAVDTKFHVGSITKEFTAAAIMHLAERGALDLDGSINGYLPVKYRSEKWRAVTVHHLLSHTSGIADYAVTRDYYHVVKGFCSRDTVDGMVREAMAKDLGFAPGSRYSYTNLGYTLLGLIIETRTNTPFDEYLEKTILGPLGMTSSKIHDFGDQPADDEAVGFRWSEELGRHVPDDVVSLPATAPDGGLITNLSDFARWTAVLAGEKQSVLSEESIRRMSSPLTRIGNGGPLDSMGYGLFVGDRLMGHGGLIAGFSSQFVFDRETRTVIVVFSNDATGNPQQVVFGLLTMLLSAGS